MNLSKGMMLTILAAFLAALCMTASGQTVTHTRTVKRTTRAFEKREAKNSEEAKAEEAGEPTEQPVERTIAADANVAVKVCVASGSITVHGWDRKEVRARSTDVAEIEFQHDGEPARKIQLLIADKAQGPGRTTTCLSFSDVEMDVPRGATVQLQTRDGDINIADVATAYVNTQNGDILIERASKAVDAGTIGGVILVKDSGGGLNLHSVGGNIEATNVRPNEASDIFDASSVGGDITLEQVGHAKLNARSLNGSLSMTGPLAHDGHYGLKTTSGDVTLSLPANSSFRVSARLSRDAEFITDFPITLMSYSSAPWGPMPAKGPSPSPEPKPGAWPSSSATPSPGSAPRAVPPGPATPAEQTAPASAPEDPDDLPKVVAKIKVGKLPKVAVDVYPLRRLDGTCGSGDATLDIGSFSGTVHLKKQ